MPLIKIKLFGEMAQRFCSEFTADIRTVRDAIAALEINFKGFREYLLNSGFSKHSIDRPSNARIDAMLLPSSSKNDL